MKVRVKAFATAADALGGHDLEVEVEPDSSIGELLELLCRRSPELGRIRERLAVAVDGALTDVGARLEPGQEIALLPPVSGGDRRIGLLVRRPLRLDELSPSEDAQSGAEVLFVGRVRSRASGRTVTSITYEAYETMAADRLDRICRELGRDGAEVRIIHRLGSVAAGEPSVVISARSRHRLEAFEACREALERLKRETPIWKKELYEDGSFAWREEEPLSAPVGAPSSIA